MKYFVAGIDTDAGKTIVTGLMARYLAEQGRKVITQKMVQTGCKTFSEDIAMHRKIMGIEMLPEDLSGQTCSYLFEFPASPHLSAHLEQTRIDPEKISDATQKLSESFDEILIEGAGGLLVPLNETQLSLDYMQTQTHPLILVASSKLGSINHTLLSLEAIKSRNIKLAGVVYNQFPNDTPLITEDSEQVIKTYLQEHFPSVPFICVPEIDVNHPKIINFEAIFKNNKTMENNNLINETPNTLSSDEKNWAMLCHLTTLAGAVIPFGYVIIPLIIWMSKRELSAFVDFAGKESVNFQIAMSIYYLTAFILSFVLIGIPILIALGVFHIIVTVIASVKTSQGEYYRYPMSIKFIS